MKRRQFLGAAALGTAAASVPSWVERAFAQQIDPDGYAANVANAYRRAALAGRPLFVIVIPAADEAKWRIGRAWGELLNNGTDEQLWPFALAEMVAAPIAAVRRIVPPAADHEGEPLAIVVETSGSPVRSVAVNVELPDAEEVVPEPPLGEASATDWARYHAEQDRRGELVIDQRIARLADAVRAGLVPSAAVIAARATEAHASLEPWERERIASVLASGARISGDLVRRGAASVALAAERNVSARPSLHARLAAVVREDIVAQPVAGARWASSWGCGTTVEGIADDQQELVACGMGHVPERSHRFLHFFAVRRAPG